MSHVQTEQWAGVLEAHTKAEAVIRSATDSARVVRETLEKGVDIATANRIVTDLWGDTSQAQRVRVRLSAGFPKENGDIILGSSMTRSLVEALQGEITALTDYAQISFTYIHEAVDELLKQFTAQSVGNEEGMALLNEMRRNVLRYCGYTTSSFWDVVDALKGDDSEVKIWADLKVVTTAESNGDYLFIDDFKDDLVRAHSNWLEEQKERVELDGDWSISSTVWYYERTQAMLRLPILFGGYLNGLLDELSVGNTAE